MAFAHQHFEQYFIARNSQAGGGVSFNVGDSLQSVAVNTFWFGVVIKNLFPLSWEVVEFALSMKNFTN